MKTKYLWILLLTVSFISCDDTTGGVGIGVLPPSDQLNVRTKPFDFKTESVVPERVFAKTSTGYIGQFTDPDFGYYKTSFLTQLNCIPNFNFEEVYNPNKNYKKGEYLKVDNKIKLTQLELLYSEFFGDSVAPARMSIYELNALLDKNHYTDINPELYYSENDLLAQRVYTAVDLSLPASERKVNGYYKLVIDLPNEVGQGIYDKYIQSPTSFKDSETFIKDVFKGIYIDSDYGDGTILYVDQISLNLVYDAYQVDTLNQLVQKKDASSDSIFERYRAFAATKEIIQANRFDNSAKITEKANEKDWTYIKSPAGIFTRVTLPIQQIADELSNDTINGVKLVFDAYKQEGDGQFSMSAPERLLLIREKDVKSFFEENKLRDNITSYIYPEVNTGKDKENQYVFSNIVNLINYCIQEKNKAQQEAGANWNESQWIEENQWDKLLLIPIVISDDGTTTPQLTGIQHDLRPRYVKLKGGVNNVLQLETNSTYFQD